MTFARAIAAALLFVPAVLSSLAGPLAAQGVFDDVDTRFSFGGVVFPAVADTFVVLRVSRWPDPGLGVVLHYSSPVDPSGSFDVYVYPRGDKDVEREFHTAVEGIVRYAERNRNGTTATVDTTHVISFTDASGRAHDGWFAAATFERNGDRRPSLLYVFEKDGRFIKYRLSHAAALRTRLEPRLQKFLAETLPGIEAATN